MVKPYSLGKENSIPTICWSETNILARKKIIMKRRKESEREREKKWQIPVWQKLPPLRTGDRFRWKNFSPIYGLFASLFHYHLFKRFVEPFSDLIHSWEKTLSLIYEIIDQWVHFTQRKWLYLEGIFVDNDARIKLPTIAAKFDLIDSNYMKVCSNKKTLFVFIDFELLKEKYTPFINFLVYFDRIDPVLAHGNRYWTNRPRIQV